MRSLALPLVVLVTTSCIPPDEDAISTVEQEARCPDEGCGVNSPYVDGGWFHELNLDGFRNDEGWAFTGASKGSAIYTLSVENARFVARLKLGPVGSQTLLTGDELVDLELHLTRSGTTTTYTATITDVGDRTEFLAKHTDQTPIDETIETYKIWVNANGSPWSGMLCGRQAIPTHGPVPMPEHSVLVFEGDRIDGLAKTVTAVNPRWFNLGCEGTALAKLHLTGRTQAAQQSVGFTTSLGERQAMLKMLTADYCGGGTPFTVGGQKLEWKDDQGTMTLPSIPLELESRWNAQGALCLNTPRVTANPTPQSEEEFGHKVSLQIAAECSRVHHQLPTCGFIPGPYNLSSHNVIE